MVQVQVFQHRVIPGQRLFARVVAFDNRATAALNRLTLRIAHFTLGDIAKRDRRPDLLACGFQGVNLVQALADTRREFIEHCLNIADLRP